MEVSGSASDNKSDKTNVLSSLDRDDLKSLFYMFTGKPDSLLKVFEDPIIVSREDLLDLKVMMEEKLESLHVDALTTSISITSDDNTVLEFSDWAEFAEKDFNSPVPTDTVTVRWDILIDVSGYENPQRHTVTVRITSGVSPIQALKYALSGDSEESSQVDYDLAPVFCRVDFINHLISQEVVNIVEKWYNGCSKPLVVGGLYKWLKKHRMLVARVIHYSTPIFAFGLGLAYFFYLTESFGDTPVTGVEAAHLSLWVSSSLFSVLFFYKASGMVASFAFDAITNYGKFAPFRLTKGDKQRQFKSKAKNEKSTRGMLLSAAYTIILNVLASILAIWLMPGS